MQILQYFILSIFQSFILPLPVLVKVAARRLLHSLLQLGFRFLFLVHCSLKHLLSVVAAYIAVLLIVLVLLLVVLILILVILILVLLILIVLILVLVLIVLVLVVRAVLLLLALLLFAKNIVVTGIVVVRIQAQTVLVSLNPMTVVLAHLKSDTHIVERLRAYFLVGLYLRSLLILAYSVAVAFLLLEGAAKVIECTGISRVGGNSLAVLDFSLGVPAGGIQAVATTYAVAVGLSHSALHGGYCQYYYKDVSLHHFLVNN